MVITSTPTAAGSNSSKVPLIVNTSAFKGEELRNFITICDEIAHLRKQPRRSLTNSKPNSKATMTREEIFECSTLEDDAFLTALEHQNSYTVPTLSTNLDLSQSIENLMRYFDEEINVDDRSGRATPTKLATVGKVASALATFKSKTLSPMPTPQCKPMFKPEVRASNIKELKKKYECSGVQVLPSHKQTAPTPPPRRIATHIKPMAITATPAPTKRKSKVKQMAQMFNAKITQFIRREGDPRCYKPLNNEFSPESKPTPKSLFTKPVSKPVLAKVATALKAPAIAPKPVPRVRVKPPTYHTGGGLPSPKPSPRPRRKQTHTAVASTNCLIAEDVFSKLSVKDKALLYQRFIEDMSRQNPKFSKHAEAIAAQAQQRLADSEVVTEKQESVKHMAQELEAKFTFPKQHLSETALQYKTKYDTYTLPRRATTSTGALMNKSKEAEDILNGEHDSYEDIHENEEQRQSLHVSTLTVVLKPSPTGKQPVPKLRLIPRKRRELRLVHSPGLVEPCHKRSNEAIRSSLPIEVYAPPKKIRRTRAERLAPKMFFQNQHMERLFYSWLKEKNGIAFDITTIENTLQTIEIAADKEQECALNSMDSETRKMAVERLLEEAIAKLESVETAAGVKSKEAKSVEEKEMDTTVNMIQELLIEQETKPQSVVEVELPLPAAIAEKDKHLQSETPVPTPRKKKQAPPPPNASSVVSTTQSLQTQQNQIASSSAGSSAMSSAKHSADESESSVPKLTSDESQPEQLRKPVLQLEQEFEFVKPIKPPRRKKMRRTLTWKKESSIIECKTAPSATTTTTTDSDSDFKIATKKSSSPPQTKPKKSYNPLKKLFHRQHTSGVAAPQQHPSSSGLNKTRMLDINSPRKIKNAYTLTVLSSPSPYTESDYCEKADAPRTPRRETSRSWPSVLTAVQQQLDAQFQEKASSTEMSAVTNPEEATPLQQQRTLMDSFIDQGFETGSNESPIDSPFRIPPPPSACRRQREGSVSPLFIKLTQAQIERPKSRRSSTNSMNRSNEIPSNFSTPVKRHLSQSFTYQSAGTHKQLFSPISAPLRSRRRSFYDVEPRRSSLTMQVIREDHPLDHNTSTRSPLSPCSPHSYSTNESAFFANAPTMDMSTTPNMTDLSAEKTSSYWVTAGDFTISMEIFHNSPDRLRLLYDIFSQKSYETRDLHFGIDDHKFSVHNPIDTEVVSERLPKVKDCTHYWFSTGDLAVPFSGKYMPGDKIKRFFRFINESLLASNNTLRFGVDNVEFSSMPDCWHDNPKLSMESNYSMLVGLQAGSSNGLEGRSKYAWPNSMCTSTNSNRNKTSDLDHSEFDSEELENSDFGRLSFSPFGSNNFDMQSVGSSDAMVSPDLFSLSYENEPLDQLFEDARKYNLSKSQTDKLARGKMNTVPEMLETLQTQKNKLKSVEKRIRSYANPINMASGDLDKIKDSSEYMRKLRNIIAAIDNIGQDNGFKACSLEQLESFMFFLSRYADICLDNCNEHMDKILDAMMDRRAVKV